MTVTYRVGVDIGGTFTDIVLLGSDGTIHTKKISSSVGNYAQAIVDGLSEVFSETGLVGSTIEEIRHGTTVASNAILEHKGARVGLITTKGFRDVLEIRTLRMPKLYDLTWTKPPPLVERYLRKVVDERIDHRGHVDRPLDPADAERAVEALLAEKVEAIAICLLHSYANPIHEQKVAEIVRRYMPNVYVAISSEVWPEFREYDRASTTVMSAYVGPVMSRYVEQLEREVKELGIPGFFQIMQSNGGVMSAAAASRRPIYSVESGPAAGVIAAAYLGGLFGEKNIISFDMGGTTAKAGLIRNGKPSISHDFHVGGKASFGGRKSGSGYPIKTPVIDLAEVGAGGGSIAWVDSGGILQVGPQSSGASPGPACYGFGGEQPTVTDANLVLGYLNADYFLGGEMRIYPEKSMAAIEKFVAKPLKMDVIAAASGIYEIVNANMASAIRVVTVQRGIDPREFALIAFGGAGPAHIVKVAEQFQIPTVIVPSTPGLTSAVGLLVSDMTNDYVRTKLMETDTADVADVNAIFRDLESQGMKNMVEEEGIPRDKVTLQRQLDVRFRFQSHELSVPVRSGTLAGKDVAAAGTAFQDLYHELYGIRQNTPTQLVNFRVRAVGIVPKVELPKVPFTGGDPHQALKGARQVYFKESGGFTTTNVYDRPRLRAGDVFSGPAVVEQTDSTVIVPPGYHASIDAYLNLVITSTASEAHHGTAGRG